jgi:hypothetical protein
MKRTSFAVILIFFLAGTPAPVKASNGMADMMRVMMEMFLWMMGGGSGGLNSYRLNPYTIGGIGNPLLTGNMLGNPLLGSVSGWGTGLPNNYLGMYSSPAYSGFLPYGSSYLNPYSNLYGIPYSSPYNWNYYGNQPYSSQGYYNPYYPNSYNAWSPYLSPYRTNPYWRPGEYSRYQNRTPLPGKKAPVVIQPIIVSPEQMDTDTQQKGESKPKVSVEVLPPVTSSPMAEGPVAPDYAYNNRVWDYDNPLYGHWEGINGEYLEFGYDRFRLRSIDAELQGTYEIKNSIIKAVIADRTEPVYMQYRLADGYLMFRSEDGQTMLFRRLP